METREETEAREKKLVDDTKRLAQSGLRKLGINIQNPLAGLDAFGEPEYDKVNRRENWAGPIIKDISTDVLSQTAIGKVSQKSLVPKLPSRSDGGRMINVTPKRANEIVTSIIDGREPKGSLTDLTTGSLGLMHPNYRPPNIMYSTGVDRPSPPFIFNGKEYTESTLIPNYQPKIVKPRSVYRERATTIEGIKGKASAVQFEKAKKEGLEWGKERTPLWKPKGTENVRTGTKLLKGYRAHHEAPLSPSASLKAGLNDEARQEADIYMLEQGIPQGDLVENVDIVPHDLHMPILHKFLDSRLGKKDLNKLVEKHYPGKQIWELELWQRKPIFDDYINTVKESREIIYQFYSALSAYDIPKGATIETVMQAALKLDNPKLELLIFEMLGSSEKLDFAADFFGAMTPKAELQPAPKGRLEALLSSQENLSSLETLLKQDRGLDKLLDRMGVFSDENGKIIIGKPLTTAEVKKKYNIPKNDNILQNQLELSLKQIKANPQLKDLIIERTPTNRLEPVKDILDRLFPE